VNKSRCKFDQIRMRPTFVQTAINDEAPVEIIIPEVANPVIVEDVLSNSPGYKPAQGKILIKHLLNHTSGLYLSKVGRATPDDLPPAYTSVPYNGNHTMAQFFTLVRVSVTFILSRMVTDLTLRETGWLSGSSSRL